MSTRAEEYVEFLITGAVQPVGFNADGFRAHVCAIDSDVALAMEPSAKVRILASDMPEFIEWLQETFVEETK